MRTPRRRPSQHAGFTLIEVGVAVVLAGVVLANILLVLSDTRERFVVQSVNKDVDAEARRALDRIAKAVMGAVRDGLYTSLSAPLSAESINFASVIGVQDGQPVVSEPQRIAMTEDPAWSVTWYLNPGQEQETHVIWARDLANLGQGEVPNGLDDNANGLIDEKGLAFEVEGPMVRITLTIERQGPDGKPVTKRLETKVTCRN